MKLTSQELTARIRDMILRGEFASGQHLREAALAEQFAVSRTPVRAALAANEKDGLLEYNPNRGFIVRPFHVRDIIEAYEMRALLEGMACRVTAERGMKLDDERVARQAIDQVEKLLRKTGPLDNHARDSWRHHNQVFHQSIIESVENRFLQPMLQMVRQIPSVYPPIFASYTAEELAQYNQEHKKILECIIDRQAVRAEHLMREHILSAGETLRTSIRDAQRTDDPIVPAAEHADVPSAEPPRRRAPVPPSE
ncbi:GntR family transcriptional regulator [Geminicoccus harenae]|uniref:GntR family transcriptional regulator n=1 Tax=Geminicoccus harenae TaxID=2498453 RepID=UPI00168BFF95|nr:GntR family transcriptional regulator [Geminicoccus harenae]